MTMRLYPLALVVLLAGCGNTHPAALQATPQPTRGVTSSPSPLPNSVPDAEACPPGDPVHLAEDQPTVTDAFVCTDEVKAVPGDGMWDFRIVKRITGGLVELLQVYATADAAPGNGACTLDLPSPRTVWLHSDKDTVAVRAPHSPCSKPTAEGIKAYDALTFEVVWEKKTRQMQTELSVSSQCSDSYKDTLSLDEQYSPGRTNSRTSPMPVSGSVSVCIYKVQADEQGDRIGHLTGHHTLTAAQVDQLNRGLAKVTVDPTCSRHEHTSFALLPGQLVIALGGCAVSQDSDWWRAGDDVRLAVR